MQAEACMPSGLTKCTSPYTSLSSHRPRARRPGCGSCGNPASPTCRWSAVISQFVQRNRFSLTITLTGFFLWLRSLISKDLGDDVAVAS